MTRSLLLVCAIVAAFSPVGARVSSGDGSAAARSHDGWFRGAPTQEPAARVAPPPCPTGTFFEFQTTRPARFVGDSALAVHPLPAVPKPRNLVQFVVDTMGAVIPETFKVILMSDRDTIGQSRQLVGKWRYTPGMVGACRVRQVVQTPIGSG